MRPLARHYAEFGFGSPDVLVLFYLRQDRAVPRRRLGARADQARHRRPFDVAQWSDRPAFFFTFVALDDAVRGARARLRLRPAQPAVPAADGGVPLLAAAGHDPAGALARPACRSPVATAARSSTSSSTPPSSARLRVDDVGRADAHRRWPRRSCCWALVGLRDKVIFLAARAEVYGPLTVALLLAGRRPRRRREAAARRHLVGRGDLEAQPALPVRRRGDDEQLPRVALRLDEAPLPPRLPRPTCDPHGSRRPWPTAAPWSSCASRCCCCSRTAGGSRRWRRA